jgi:hypothetical protein
MVNPLKRRVLEEAALCMVSSLHSDTLKERKKKIKHM